MQPYRSIQEISEALAPALALDGGVKVKNASLLNGELIDRLVYTAVFAADDDSREAARWAIRAGAAAAGTWSASIHDLYAARGRGECAGFTVPAINIRGLTYDVARAVFRAALGLNASAVILEIARSEIGYTFQRPAEYTTVVTAAALREGYGGPIFLQGDHFQFSSRKYAADPEAETRAVLDLTREAIAGGFMNIDIDSSTLVDLSFPTVAEQQRVNSQRAAQCTAEIRRLEPEGITISVGGEIGEVGKKNSTAEELIAFMDGLQRALEEQGVNAAGPSKISVQTGTSHGGVPLADGSVAEVQLDFSTLEKLSLLSRQRYGMAGAVQHGASTLPEDLFDRFPRVETAEIHLATGFQNLIYSHPAFPAGLLAEVDDHLRQAHADERKKGQTDEQFIYKTRKKGFGAFKQAMWDLDASILADLGLALEQRFAMLFEKLGVRDSRDTVNRFVRRADPPLTRPSGL